MCFICRLTSKLVSIFVGIVDDSDGQGGPNGSNGKSYRPMRTPRPCENCGARVPFLYSFNTAWLCEQCFKSQSIKFPTVVPKDERINSDSSDAVNT